MKIDIENYGLSVRLKGRTDYFNVEKVFVNTCQVRVKERENVWNTVDFSFVSDWKLSAETTPEPQEDKPKYEYKVGDKVKLIEDIWHGNWADPVYGKPLTITAKQEGTYYVAENSYKYHEKWIEPYPEPEQPKLKVTRQMLIDLGACNGGIAAFDRLFPSGETDYETAVEKACCDAACCNGDYDEWLMQRKDRIADKQNEQSKEPIAKTYLVKVRRLSC